jgi:cytochrome c oxidase subunit III
MSPERLTLYPIAPLPSHAAKVDVADGSRLSTLREDQLRLGLWMFLGTVTMLFAAFTSAYIVRRSGSDWRRVALPSVLWLNTLILAASSAALEASARTGAQGQWAAAKTAVLGALTLGFGFLGGQIVAWRQMVAAGVYLPSSPHSSFFFMVTGVHALHVVAALVVLAWGAVATWSGHRNPRAWSVRMGACRTFWHYLGAVWLFLFALVSLY